MSRNTLFLLILIYISPAFTSTAWAGPNWNAIESARSEKQQQIQQEAIQKTKQESALEKIQAACRKVKGDAELKQICEEILAGYQELEAAY